MCHDSWILSNAFSFKTSIFPQSIFNKYVRWVTVYKCTCINEVQELSIMSTSCILSAETEVTLIKAAEEFRTMHNGQNFQLD